MPDRIHNPRPTPLLALVALASAALLAGCGGSSNSSTVTGGGTTTLAAGTGGTSSASSTTTGTGTTSSGSTAPSVGSGPLAFARCMRANGVPNFPDPSSGSSGAFQIPAGANPSSPAFRAAQAKCQKLMGGGPPVPGTTTHPSPQTLAKLVRIAQCMRQHGISDFPDPRTSVPAQPAGIGEITNFDGVILLFPATMNLQAPAYRQALTACGAPPLGLPH